MNSWSSRCIRNGTQASPPSIQITGSLGKRSPSPLVIQLVMCRMLKNGKPSACTAAKRLSPLNTGSPILMAEWKASASPRSSMARNTFMLEL